VLKCYAEFSDFLCSSGDLEYILRILNKAIIAETLNRDFPEWVPNLDYI
jgi:hypothetical protein